MLGNSSPSAEARALPQSSTAPGASDASAKPQTATPGQSLKADPGTSGDDNLLASAIALLEPLLDALGLGGAGSTDGEMVDVVMQLAETLLGVVMDVLGGGK